jgi:uncharacterized spore protein YtfJ
MTQDKDGGGRELFRAEMVRGEPYHVGGRTLTPVARIVSFGRARATIGTKKIGGWAGGFVHVRPLAFEEETDEGVRRIAIPDPTSRALRGMLAAAVATTLFLGAIRWLAGCKRRSNGAHRRASL